jgi:asparagine synthase (glutamine-hydrolysing)
MCGIIGIIDPQSNEEQLRAVMPLLRHRGPDGEGFYADPPLYLGHLRLAIQDVSDKAQQPMHSADGRYTLVYNGELYNHPELRRQLEHKGQVFRSASDTETLLYACVHYGVAAALPLLNGIFAFAFYDHALKRLWLARDAFGVKPLYYHKSTTRCLFASELKALLPLLPERTLAMSTFYQTLLLQWPLGTATGFKEVQSLAPGHWAEIDLSQPGAWQPKKWYQYPFTGQYKRQSEAAWVKELDTALNKAVKRQLLSDRPIGYFLSGGLDSSLLLAIAQRLQPGKPLPAFTLDTGNAFRKEGFGDDLAYARQAAAHLRMPLMVTRVAPDVMAGWDDMIWHLDQPQADIAPMLVYALSKAAAAADCPVMIGGVGGDDLFSGYRRHQAMRYEGLIRASPLFLLRGFRRLAQLLPENSTGRRLRKLTRAIDKTPQQRMLDYFYWTSPEQASALLQDHQAADPAGIARHFEKLLAEIPAEQGALNRMLYLDMHTFLPDHNLNYTDKMGMAAGVEIRVPFLDRELATLSAAMPPGLKMKGTTTKYLLRKVAESYLPREVIYRSKTGLGAPVRSWIQEDAGFRQMLRERLTDPSFTRRQLFDSTAIEDLIKATESRKTDGSFTLLALLSIESWLRQFAA